MAKSLGVLPEKDFFSSKKISKILPVEEDFSSFEHNLSHKKLLISVKVLTIKNKDRLSIDRRIFNWVNISDSVNMGIPKPVKDILKKYD